MAALRDLVNSVRAGGLPSSELLDPTITVTNLGERGCATVYPVIYPPQVAIVSFRRSRKKHGRRTARSDSGRLRTLDGCVTYLAAKTS